MHGFSKMHLHNYFQVNITEDETTEDEESFMVKLEVPLHESAVVLDLNSTTIIIIEDTFNSKRALSDVHPCITHAELIESMSDTDGLLFLQVPQVGRIRTYNINRVES